MATTSEVGYTANATNSEFRIPTRALSSASAPAFFVPLSKSDSCRRRASGARTTERVRSKEGAADRARDRFLSCPVYGSSFTFEA